MSNTKENRRNFIKNTAGAAIAVSSLTGMMPASVLGANDKIRMGIIGPGGRGRGLMRGFANQGADFIAVCDAYQPNAQEGLKIAGDGAKNYKEYRQLLENKDIDAVLIATPEHQHGTQLIAAVDAGKDAYCEKPMSHSIEEGNKMIKAVRATNRIVQIGMQRRSTPALLEAKKIVDEGKLGRVCGVKAQWNWLHPLPLDPSPLQGEFDWKAFCAPGNEKPFKPEYFHNWRVFWDFSGGHVCDQGTHLMDVIQWFTKSNTPQMAECFGRIYTMNGAETPDLFTAIIEYENFNASWILNYNNQYQNGWMITFEGEKGTLVLTGWGSRFYQGGEHTFDDWDPSRKPDWEFRGPLSDQDHIKNFLDCVKSRKEPNAPVEVGHRAVCGPHLANVAYKNKKRAYLNKDATQVTV